MAGGAFFDRRCEFREVIEDGVAVLEDGGARGGVLRLVNWSRGGFLAFGRDWQGGPGEAFQAALALTSAGRRFHFRCAAEVVRSDPELGFVAARFVRVEPAVRSAIDRHFDPAASLADAAYAAGSRCPAAGERQSPGGVPAPDSGETALPAVPVPAGGPVFASLRGLDRAGLDATADCLAAVKAAFARRFHPDAASPGTAPEERALRARLFQEFWGELDAMERGVRAMREAERG